MFRNLRVSKQINTLSTRNMKYMKIKGNVYLQNTRYATSNPTIYSALELPFAPQIATAEQQNGFKELPIHKARLLFSINKTTPNFCALSYFYNFY